MYKLWVKIIRDERIAQSIIYTNDKPLRAAALHDYMIDICEILDIPTPMVLGSHMNNFEKFNITRFKSSDFVESVDFEMLELENATDK